MAIAGALAMRCVAQGRGDTGVVEVRFRGRGGFCGAQKPLVSRTASFSLSASSSENKQRQAHTKILESLCL